jgi:N6-L-threonylcarbamoyladenine synthase
MEMHARFGGVFPEVASRQHVLSIMPVIEKTLADAHLTLSDVDAIAVTRGPGLTGSLIVGMNAAKGLVLGSERPLLGVNHLEGHLYSAWVHDAKEDAPPEPQFPIMALLVSGGHSELSLMTDHLSYQRLGGTLDDAAGEAFDKVARMLGLPYPGGPSIQKIAKDGDPKAFDFPRSWLGKSYDFSFSGLKTADLPVADLAASFQAAVVDVVFTKTINAAREYGAKEILVAGGVSANQSLRETFLAQDEFPVNIPHISLCTDNAAMIAAAGYRRFMAGQRDELNLDILPTWRLS